MGVTREHGKYRARVTENGKRKSLGSYPTKRQAEQRIKQYKAQQSTIAKQEDELEANLINLYGADALMPFQLPEREPKTVKLTRWEQIKQWLRKRLGN